MEGIDLDQCMTQENDCEILASKTPTTTLRKEKGPRCIVDSVHLNSLANSYKHH
jgi:hypothetical protein